VSRNIVVFSDGTGQEGGTDRNTNVYKTFNLILDRSPNQISFYDQGLGTGFRKFTGNVFGRGFSENVRHCYQFIFDNYQEGDQIFLFGFSRGAATVRSLAGFIHMFGILPRSRGKLVNEAWKIYKKSDPVQREKAADRFIEVNHTMWAMVKFLGVWDTVAALGLPDTHIDRLLNWIVPHGFHDFKLSDCVANAYHALAIDDMRKSFHPVLFEPGSNKKGELKQVWFMGMHTDVGGGYWEKELSDIVLEWMIGHAVKHGLDVYASNKLRGLCTPNPNGHMHDSIDKKWKKWVFPKSPRKWPKPYEHVKPVLHESVELRTASPANVPDGGYQPWIKDGDYEVEPWTHLDDWKNDPDFDDPRKKRNLEALEGWCKPPGSDGG
jgi:uncharacterized protein (DUF2235 family)